MNALEYLRKLVLPPPNPLFHDALTIISADTHVHQLDLYPLITSDRLHEALSAMLCGMAYAERTWGEAVIPAQLVLARDINRGDGVVDWNACCIGVGASHTPILYITNAFLAHIIAQSAVGSHAHWHHLPRGMTLPARHVLALIMIEECIHTGQLRRGMRPQGTTTINCPDDPMEEEVRRMMPDILRDFAFAAITPPPRQSKGTL